MRLLCIWSVLAVIVACPAGEAAASEAGVQAATRVKTVDFQEVVRRCTDQVFPAVVFIKVLRESYEEGKKTTMEVSGSGFLISAAGEVLTNHHVADKAVKVRCLLFDGRAMEAELVGSDKDTDLALLKLKIPEGDSPVPFAKMGDSAKLTEGDFVMAMGAPWGLNRSVSIGIVSCTRRFLPTHSQYSLWLQTDSAISPGNSGGPLVDTKGKVVGVVALGVMRGGDMGFAIPVNTVRHIVAQLREHGRMRWAWTGLQLQPLRDFERDMYFDASEGVIVADTDRESPARRAGILPKDRIVKINGQGVTATTEEDLPAIRRQLGLLPKGKPAVFELVRDGKPVTAKVTPREKGKVEGEELELPRWDFTIKTINQFDNKDLYFYRKKGVFIYGIKYPGNAGNADLSRNDILMKVDGKDVRTLDDVKTIHAAALKNIAQKHRIVITVLRNGLQRQVVLNFSRDYEKE